MRAGVLMGWIGAALVAAPLSAVRAQAPGPGAPVGPNEGNATPARVRVGGPTCRAPKIPKRFADDREQNHFVDAANQYEACIKRYIQARQAEAAAQSREGNAAAEAFNRFARAAARVQPPEPQ